MPLKTFLATVEVRVVVNVPEDFSEDDFNNSFEIIGKSKPKVVIGKKVIEDIQVLDVSSDNEDCDNED
jgi:hypothetical protein